MPLKKWYFFVMCHRRPLTMGWAVVSTGAQCELGTTHNRLLSGVQVSSLGRVRE